MRELRQHGLGFVVPLFIALILNSLLSAAAKSALPAEDLILKNLRVNRVTDLSGVALKSDAVVRASFLQSILTNTTDPNTANKPITLIGAEIIEDLSLNNATVPVNVSLKKCTFRDLVALKGVTFDKSLEIDSSQFSNGLVLEDLSIKGSFIARDIKASVRNKDKQQTFSITRANVDGSVELIDPDVAPLLSAVDLKAKDLIVKLNVNRLALDLKDINVDTLRITGDFGVRAAIDRIDVTGGHVNNDFYLRDVSVIALTAPRLAVGGLLLLSRSNVTSLDLSLASIGGIWWSQSGGDPPKNVELGGTSFHDMLVSGVSDVEPHGTEDPTDWSYPPEQDESFATSKALLLSAPYSPTAFDSYEQSLTNRGQLRRALDIFTAGRHSRRSSRISMLDPLSWLWCFFDVLQEYGLGYGRVLFWPCLWSVLIVLIGVNLFRPNRMIRKAESFVEYSRFWYSIGLFLPVVDLGVAKDWKPSGNRLATYASFHQFAGWVLIPVMVAIATGFTK